MSNSFLIVISCGLDNPNRSVRGLHLATVAQKEGRDVTVFLLDDAVFLVKKGLADNLRAATGDIASDLIFHLQSFQVPMLACTPCAQTRRIREEDLIEGARFATAVELIGLSSQGPVISL